MATSRIGDVRVILNASIRIGKEINKVPKAAGRPTKIIARAGKNTSGRATTGIPASSRSRLTKLADHGMAAARALPKWGVLACLQRAFRAEWAAMERRPSAALLLILLGFDSGRCRD